jgi:hypothetical protein
VDLAHLAAINDTDWNEGNPLAGRQECQQDLRFDFKMRRLDGEPRPLVQVHQPETALGIRQRLA